MAKVLLTSSCVCDSEPIFRAGISQILARQQVFVAAETATSDAAVEAVHQRRPHCLVVGRPLTKDLVELCLRVKQIAPRLAILCLVDGVEVREAEPVWAMGVNGLIGRYATESELATALGAMRNGERFLAPEFHHLVGLDPTFERPALENVPGRTLTTTEIEVLGLVAKGLTNEAIAQRLDRKPETIKSHLKNTYAKLEVHSRNQAVAKAVALGLLG